MSKNKYLLLISSLGVLALLVAAAVHENFLREWRAIQRTARSDEGAINVRLRQVVNPTLRISDRCVSCHVSMAPGEQSVTGAKILRAHQPVVHDPSEFGCTICHRRPGAGDGQSRRPRGKCILARADDRRALQLRRLRHLPCSATCAQPGFTC